MHDPVGGIEDLEQHRVRFIGDPAMRIAEDYLRILRFFRFHAAYGRGAPDPDGLHACIVAREGLRKLSRERLRAELFKLLIAPRAAPTLVVMAEAGLLEEVLGGVPYLAGVANVIAVEAVLGFEPDPLRRLAGLAVSIALISSFVSKRVASVDHVRSEIIASRYSSSTACKSATSDGSQPGAPGAYGARTSVRLTWEQTAASANAGREAE